MLRVAAVHDSGRILNPIGASGQVYGGVVMGIGQALTEGTQLDEAGRQRNPHLLDYKLATASDVPRIDIALGRDAGASTAARTARRAWASRRACRRAGAIANAIAQAIGRARPRSCR